jgi:hypothetical protein
MYWEPELPNGQQWEERCSLKTLACLRFHAAFGSLVDKKKRSIQYKKLRKHFCSTTPNVDLLITNHILGICSCLGLLPTWVRSEIEVSSTKSRYMKWFLEYFNLPSCPDTLEQIMENLRSTLSSRYGVPFTRRKLENILCKVYRNRTGSTSDQKYYDLAFLGQMLFECEGDALRISYLSGSEFHSTLVDDFLVSKWSFQNTLLTVEDILGRLGMSDKGVPTSKEASNWSVPDSLMFGRSKTTVEFDISHRVVASCNELFRFNLEKICSKLR